MTDKTAVMLMLRKARMEYTITEDDTKFARHSVYIIDEIPVRFDFDQFGRLLDIESESNRKIRQEKRCCTSFDSSHCNCIECVDVEQ